MEMISYVAIPGGTRFRQYACDPVPQWAIDIQPEAAEPTYAELAQRALANLPKPLQDFCTTQAYDRGHSAGQDEVDMLTMSIANDLHAAFNAYLVQK